MSNTGNISRPASVTPTSLIDLALRATWRVLQRNGILYLLSALFMLLGCYLICFPHLLEYKQISSLLTLLSVVNCYEIMVIAACVYILRRLPTSREISTLLVVEVLFLFDATFTNNSCLAVNFSGGLFVLVVALTLGVIKIFILESAAGTERSLFGESRGVLLAGLVFTYSFQPVLAAHAPLSTALQSFSTHLVWLGYGALTLFLRRPKSASAPAAVASTAEMRAVFQEENLQRVVMGIALIVPLIHVAGQSWVHRAPFEWEFLLTVLVALATIAPQFLNVAGVAPYLRVGAIAVLGWNVLSSESWGWNIRFPWLPAELSDVRVNLIFASGCFGLAWLRSRRTSRLDLGLAAMTALFAIAGSQAGRMYEFLIVPKIAKVVFIMLISTAWIYFDRNYWMNFALALANVFLILQLWSIGNELIQMPREFYYSIPIVCFLTILCFRSRADIWAALIPFTAIFVSGCMRAGEPGGVALAFTIIAFLTLSAGYLLYERSAIYAVCGYVAIVLVRRHGAGASVGISWGWIAIAVAFALFALAFYVTRSRLGGEIESSSDERPSSTFLPQE